jgi:hypothetical protein
MIREDVVEVKTSGKPRVPRIHPIALAWLPLVLVSMVDLARSGYGSAPLQALAVKAGGSGDWVEAKNEKAALTLDRTPFAGQPVKAVTYLQ